MIKTGILGAADIAYSKFLPALMKVDGIECAGVASARGGERLERFEKDFGVNTFDSYEQILDNPDIDMVYIPLPPAFHYEWAKKALLAGKHVLVEKPFTMTLEQAEELVDIASKKGLAIQENYMFIHHAQLRKIKEIIESGKLGKVWLIRESFGFPRRAAGDFRYEKKLGGGTMMDNGGYTIRLVTELLGDTVKLVNSNLRYEDNGIDIFGMADFVNAEGVMAQVAFGMDCQYQCSLEIWGSAGRLTTGRIFTAPAGFNCSALLECGGQKEEIVLSEDDHFKNAIEDFIEACNDETKKKYIAEMLLVQAGFVDAIVRKGE